MADRLEQPDDSSLPQPAASQPGSAALAAAYIAIDACRPGSEDLERQFSADVSAAIRRDDRLAARYRSVQQFDHSVAGAFSAVPVPAGLADRLLAAIAEQQAQAQQAELEFSPATTPVERPTRRRWLQITGGALASLAAGGGFLWWRQSSAQPDLSLEDVLERTLAFHQSADAYVGDAVPVSRSVAPAEYPMSRLLVGLRNAVRWRPLDGRFLGRAGVAYELAAPGEPSATLYVLASDGRLGAPGIPALPDQPLNPNTTGGFTLAGWREADRIQLLVVEGDAARYRSFLTHPSDVA